MQVLPENTKAIDQVVKILKSGGIVAHATETCYGLACDLSNPDAVRKLFEIKNRPLTYPVSALFETVTQAKKYVKWNDRAEELATKYLPGPLTLILPMKSDAPEILYPVPDGSKTIGVRISPNTTAQRLAQLFGKPISTTSANMHGEPNPFSAQAIIDQGVKPDLIIDSGELKPTDVSRVIDLTGSEEKILRS